MNDLRRIISVLTFPGIIIHEFGHALFCKLTGVKVFKVVYFRFGNPAGYVIHEKTAKFYQSFFITTGPFIVGSLIALALFYYSGVFSSGFWQKYVLIWLGVSSAMNAFPSATDADGLWKDTNRMVLKNIFAVIGYPFALIIWIADALTIIWFDLIYALILFWFVK